MVMIYLYRGEKMDIEIIEDESKDHYDILLKYIKENVYSKMSKKDAESIGSNSLNGGLKRAIWNYKNSEVLKAIAEVREEWKRDVEGKNELIERLRNGKSETEYYSKRSDNYVGD